MVQITWNTDVNAPCCLGEILADNGESVLIQTDWDYPGVASTFGWSVQNVQKPIAERTLQSALTDLDGIDTLAELTRLVGECWQDESENPCRHSETDGTVDCPECGVTAGEFIGAASEWLSDNDGATADDPGYFGE